MNQLIKAVTIDGKEIQRIVFDRLIPAIEGEVPESAFLSLLTFAVMMMKPDISIDQLQEIVIDASEHILLSMTEVPAKAN